MQPRCSCGALLPEDARFCHKCGKPQYEEDLARLNEPLTEASALRPPPPVAAGQAARIGFSNLRAVSITIMVAVCSLIALSVASVITPFLAPLVLCGAGFAAAKLYKSRVVEPLTPFNGATLGVMTGFWLFLILVVCVIVISIAINSPGGQEILKAFNQKVPEFAAILSDPRQMALALALEFFVLTILAAFGGMLAARFEARNSRPS